MRLSLAVLAFSAALGSGPLWAHSASSPRPSGVRVAVSPKLVSVDDGDTVAIRWSRSDVETVRILGIDTPETRHVAHDIPFDQPFGPEARAFAQGVFANAQSVELLRAKTLDPYGRTLGYVFVNGATMVIPAKRHSWGALKSLYR